MGFEPINSLWKSEMLPLHHTHYRNNYMRYCNCCQAKTTNLKYCSKSCAAKINNKLVPKRTIEKQNLCLECNKKLSRYKGQRKTQLCLKCFNNNKIKTTFLKTKKEMTELSYDVAHKYEKIRQHAKRYAKKNNWVMTICEKCGYDKHTELCHRKPIYSFLETSILKEINCRENIIFLCPNCHWELDNIK